MNIAGRMHWMHLKLPGITVSVQPRLSAYGYVFTVTSVTDLGGGRRIAALRPLPPVSSRANSFRQQSSEFLALPRRIGELELIYTGGVARESASIDRIIQAHCGAARARKVTEAVLMPGDIVVCKEGDYSDCWPDIYRIVQPSQLESLETQYAL